MKLNELMDTMIQAQQTDENMDIEVAIRRGGKKVSVRGVQEASIKLDEETKKPTFTLYLDQLDPDQYKDIFF